ncbi:MAG: GGDEF domain-containing protein [Candidatus Izemoplasmataceae bacterium]
MKHYRFLGPYLLLLGFIIFLISLGIVYNDRYKLSFDEPKTFDSLYYYKNSQESILLEDLPVDLVVEPNTNYMIYTTLGESFNETSHLLIRTSLANVSVRIDGVLLYEVDYEEYGAYASMWHVVDIPANQEGATLELTFSSPYAAMSGTVNQVYYGETASLYSEIYNTHGFRLIVGLLTLLIGITIMIVSFIFFRKHNFNNMFIGLFAILLSFWLISESRTLQFFIGNIYILGSISYLALALFPMPLLYYIRNTILVKEKNPINIMLVIFAINFLFVFVGHEINLIDYFESVIITLNIFALSFVALIGILLYELKIYDNKKTKFILKTMITLLVFAFLELIVFILGVFDLTGMFATIGVVVVLIIIFINYAKFFLDRLKLSYEKEFYERLAYVDPLTKAGNRLAFNETFEKYFEEDARREKLRLIYFDLNNLKTINDEYGHLAGDEAIKAIYECIEKVFLNHADCFRIGGDEFACLSTTIDDNLYDRYSRLFLNEMVNKSHKFIFPFSSAIGSIVYDKSLDQNISDMMRRCDIKMYKHKKVMKEEDSF